MTKVDPNNRNEIKSDIFPWDILKSGVIYFLYQKMVVFQWLAKSKFLSFITEVNPYNEHETNQTFFHGTCSNLISFFIGPKVLKYFNDFHNWHLSISLQMWAQTKIKIKRDICKSYSIFPHLQSSTLFKWLLRLMSW